MFRGLLLAISLVSLLSGVASSQPGGLPGGGSGGLGGGKASVGKTLLTAVSKFVAPDLPQDVHDAAADVVLNVGPAAIEQVQNHGPEIVAQLSSVSAAAVGGAAISVGTATVGVYRAAHAIEQAGTVPLNEQRMATVRTWADTEYKPLLAEYKAAVTLSNAVKQALKKPDKSTTAQAMKDGAECKSHLTEARSGAENTLVEFDKKTQSVKDNVNQYPSFAANVGVTTLFLAGGAAAVVAGPVGWVGFAAAGSFAGAVGGGVAAYQSSSLTASKTKLLFDVEAEREKFTDLLSKCKTLDDVINKNLDALKRFL